MSKQETYEIYSIGQVRRDNGEVRLEIEEPFRPALQQLDEFSHVIAFWWSNQLDSEEHRSVMSSRPPYAEDKETGVFASRSPLRPNPINMTTCKILGVDQENGVVRVADIDAFDETPLLDLKAYFPVCDRVQDARIPDWLAGWPEWMPENGLGLEQ